MLRLGGRLAVAGVLFWPHLVAADALGWLQRMNEAVRATTYEGVAVYRTGDRLETLRVYHRSVDGQEQERMVSLSGDLREVNRDDDSVTCILPEQKVIVVDNGGLRGLLPNLPRAAFEQLTEHYTLSEVGRARIAGQACRGIEIRARDNYRYSYRIWVDETTALPLSVNLLGSDDEILEQVVFTQISYPDTLPDEVFESSVATEEFATLAPSDPDTAAQSDPAQWELAELPDGFRLATRDLQRLPGVSTPIAHMLFTDGLAAVSVFTAPQTLPENAFRGVSRMGGVNAYGRTLDGYHITVVGEVPQTTVRFFGDNVRRRVTPDR